MPAAEPAPGETLLRVENLVKHFEITGGLLGVSQDRRRPGRGRRLVQRPQGRDPGPRRRVRLRQDDARQGHPAPAPGDVGEGHGQGRGPLRHPDRGRAQGRQEAAGHRRDRDEEGPPRPAGRLPGPVRQPQPAHVGRRDRRRGAAGPRPDGQGEARGPRPRAAGPRRPEPEPHPPLPARVQRRPAPADRDRPGAGPEPRLRRLRRARLGPRRLDPEPGAQPARRPPAGARADLPLHRPQPRGRRAHQRPGRA